MNEHDSVEVLPLRQRHPLMDIQSRQQPQRYQLVLGQHHHASLLGDNCETGRCRKTTCPTQSTQSACLGWLIALTCHVKARRLVLMGHVLTEILMSHVDAIPAKYQAAAALVFVHSDVVKSALLDVNYAGSVLALEWSCPMA